MATRKFRKFESGGSTDKEEGLKASKDEKVGFLERMRMGNIDEEGSEAYNRFGAGRGKAERAKNVPVEDRVATPVKRETEEDKKPTSAMRDRAEEQGKKQDSGDASVAEAYQGARKEPVFSTPAKLPAKPAVKPESKTESKVPAKAETNKPAKSSEASSPTKSSRSLVDQIPRDKATPVSGEKVDSTELSRNINNALNATPGIQAVGRMKAAGQAAQKAGSRALSTAVDDGVTYLGKSGRRQVGGFDEVAGSGARQLANNPTRQLPAPPKQISGPSKADLVARDRAARDAARKETMNEENAARHGLNRKDPDFAEKASEVRRNLGGSDFSLGMKRGGKVKSKPSAPKPAAKGWGMARGARPAKMR